MKKCNPGQLLNRQECKCTCSLKPVLHECPSPKVWDDEHCVCRCPSPPTPCFGGIINTNTCECECRSPKPLKCGNTCCDPLNDDDCCGGCDGPICDTPQENCCNGKCTELCTDTDCRSCGDAVPPGWKCCSCKPTRLGTKENCATCGEKCERGNRVCRPREHGAGYACQCPVGWDVCDDTCVNLKNNNDNCGSCGNKCPAGRDCSNGVCACPTGTLACGSTPCCQSGQACCGGTCVDTKISNAHCGGCDAPCTSMNLGLPDGSVVVVNRTCVNGKCDCPQSFKDCGKVISPSGLTTLWACCPAGSTSETNSGRREAARQRTPESAGHRRKSVSAKLAVFREVVARRRSH
jgi:hypothetical protein